MPKDKRIHLRIWSNNKYDRDAACGLFWRGNDHRWTHSPEDVTCEDCKAKFPNYGINPDGSREDDE